MNKFVQISVVLLSLAVVFLCGCKDEEDPIYTVTVTGGTASPESGKTGTSVTLTVGNAPEGQMFKEWNVVSGGVTISGNTFTIGTADVVIAAVWEDIPPSTYSVTVNGGGTASPIFGTAGTQVTLTPGNAPEGQRFKEWNVVSGGVTVTGNTFTLCEANVVIEAVWEDIPTYAVTVTNGTGSGNYAEDETVSIAADPAPEGMLFKEWDITPEVSFTTGSRTTHNAAFTMPAEDVTAVAVYEAESFLPENVVFAANGEFALSDNIVIEPVFIVNTQGKDWTALSNDETWLSVSQSGNNFTLSVVANTGAPREAIVTVTVEGEDPMQFTIRQIGVGDITNLVLKNTETPFATTGEPKYENGADMAWLAAYWKVNEAAAISGNVRLGANSWDPQYDLGMTGWTGAFENGKLFQTVELEAGTYRYVVVGFLGDLGGYPMYITAALGDDLPDTDKVEQDALGFFAIPDVIGNGTTYFFEFVLTHNSTVSLGFVANMYPSQAYFSKIELWKDL